MSQIAVFQDDSSIPDIEKLYGDQGGDVEADSSYRIGILGGTGVKTVGTPASNIITVNAVGGGLTWATSSTGQNFLSNTAYIHIAGSVHVHWYYLPTSSEVGDMIALTLDGGVGWRIVQGAGQQIRFGDKETTLGINGKLESSAQGDTVTLVCSVANTRWIVVSSVGNITIV